MEIVPSDGKRTPGSDTVFYFGDHIAKDSIYLCNFRVSVDGDWLCLKELGAIDADELQSPEDGLFL